MKTFVVTFTYEDARKLAGAVLGRLRIYPGTLEEVVTDPDVIQDIVEVIAGFTPEYWTDPAPPVGGEAVEEGSEDDKD